MSYPHDSSETTAHDASYNQAAALARLQEAIDVSDHATILSWSRRYNELSLISRLPPELLSLVFEFVQGGIVAPYREYYPGSWSIGWISSVSHVCSYWRQVALAHPILWTNIDAYCQPPSLRWSTEMLTRSQTAPLTVVAGHSKVPPEKLWEFVAAAVAQLYRIRELVLSCHDAEASPGFLALLKTLSFPAPLLETCSIAFSWSTWEMLPGDIFRDCPQLNHLTLINCGLNWKSMTSLSNLRSLSFEGNQNFKFQPPAHLFFASLSHMTHLEKLTLQSSFFALPDGSDLPPSPIANLPLLRSLNFRSTLPRCNFFLEHIVYPGTTTVVMSILLGPYKADISPPAFWAAIKRLYQPLNNPIISLFVDERNFMFSDQDDNHPYRVHVTSNDEPSDVWDNMEMAKNIPGLLSLHCLKLLRIGLCLEPVDWLGLFGDLPELQTIRISYHSLGEFLCALSGGTSSPTNIADHPAIPTSNNSGADMKFEALQCLSFYACYTHALGRIYEQLRHCLMARQVAGHHELKTLELYDSSELCWEDKTALRALVKHVHWIP